MSNQVVLGLFVRSDDGTTVLRPRSQRTTSDRKPLSPGMAQSRGEHFVRSHLTSLRTLIPSPANAHAQDDASALSLPALKRWCRILRVFVAEYLDLAAEDMKRRDNDASRRDGHDELVRTDVLLLCCSVALRPCERTHAHVVPLRAVEFRAVDTFLSLISKMAGVGSTSFS